MKNSVKMRGMVEDKNITDEQKEQSMVYKLNFTGRGNGFTARD